MFPREAKLRCRNIWDSLSDSSVVCVCETAILFPGTGLSYAPDKEDEQKLSDTSVTEATAAFLQSFFEEYSEFQPNPLFIAGRYSLSEI